MAENKVVSTARINAVESGSKLKNLEKEVKEKTISEMKAIIEN
jgi:hypothetical protein